MIESVQRRTCCTWRWLQDRQSPVAVLKSESCGSALKSCRFTLCPSEICLLLARKRQVLRRKLLNVNCSAVLWRCASRDYKSKIFLYSGRNSLQMFCGFMFKKKKMSVISKKLVYIVKELHLSSSYLFPKVRMFSP